MHVEVGAEPVRVVPEHDVERPVGVRREPARPRRPTGEVNRSRNRLECDGVDLFDPRDGLGPRGVAQEVHLARIA